MRSPLAPVLVGMVALAACGGAQSEASGEPLPTIGLESDLGAGLAPGAVSGAADVRAIGAGDVDTIVMIGDSITVAATEPLETGFASLGFEDVRITSQTSKRMAQSFGGNASGAEIAALLTIVPEDDPSADDGSEGTDTDETDPGPLGPDHSDELWIVALGTNDINQYAGPPEIAIAVDEVLAAVPDDAAIVWVDTYLRDFVDGAAEVNAVVSARLAARGNAAIAPWSAVADGEGVLRSDGIHPSSAGADLFAGVVIATTADFLGR